MLEIGGHTMRRRRRQTGNHRPMTTTHATLGPVARPDRVPKGRFTLAADVFVGDAHARDRRYERPVIENYGSDGFHAIAPYCQLQQLLKWSVMAVVRKYTRNRRPVGQLAVQNRPSLLV